MAPGRRYFCKGDLISWIDGLGVAVQMNDNYFDGAFDFIVTEVLNERVVRDRGSFQFLEISHGFWYGF